MGALVTIAGVYLLGQRDGEIDSTTLLLGGIITASFLNALIMLLLNLISERDHGGMSFWLMGDLSTPLQSQPTMDYSRGFLSGRWRDLHDGVGSESVARGRKRSHSSGSGRAARAHRRVCRRVDPYRVWRCR